MSARLRVAAWWEQLRGSLWFVPALFVAAALVLGTALALGRPLDREPLAGLVFAGSAEGGRTILGVIAGAMITVTSLTFSLTVVALQMASGQFSPRVLRTFLTDLGNQVVLGTFLATFAYSLAVIRVIQDGEGVGDEVVPRLAITVGIVLALLAVGALVYFIHHLARQLLVDSVMDEIVKDTLRAIDRVYPDTAVTDVPERALPKPRGRVHRVPAQRSGYLQAVTVEGLVEATARLGGVVQLRTPVGGQIPEGATLAWVWSTDGAGDGEHSDADWRRAAHDHVHLGRERTLRQDVAFGLQQLVDIAVRALSPGINDPTTAVDALGRLSRLVCCLTGRRLDVGVRTDADGRVRALLPVLGFAEYLNLACDLPRRHGAREPQVLLALLQLLVDVAETAGTEHQRAAIDRECARTLELARRELDEDDMARIETAADQVREALQTPRH